MPRSSTPNSTTRTRRRASITVEDIQSPETPHLRRPVLPSLPNSEPANLPTRHRSRPPTVSSRARQARSETDDDTEDEDSDAEDDDNDIADHDQPPQTPCPTCHRGARGLKANSNPSSRSPSPDDSSDAIDSDSDTSLDMSRLSLGSSAEIPVVPIDFQPFNRVPLPRVLIDMKVFHTILPAALDERKKMRGTDGYIYILEDTKQPGYVKIGMTSKNPHDRSVQIQRCKVVHPELIKGQDFTIVPCYKRLERIIFADLWNERRCFLCEKCGRRHKEWFQMGKEEALLRVKLWQQWMRREPYDASQGLLKREWRERIKALEKDPSYAETIETEHASGNYWQTFMREREFLGTDPLLRVA